ncbi:hypothetical protein K9M79_00160 [Candidatus Woesearchaeota archaeon]|nr:hypothetical protein [Candidatus Woesearchaeota archaeon]
MKYITMGILALLTVGLIAASVSAFGGQFIQGQNKMTGMDDRFGGQRGMNQLSTEDRELIDAQHEAIQTAIDNEDYSAWSAAVNTMHELRAPDTSEEAFNEILERHSDMQSNHENMEAIFEALEDKDYTTWKSLVDDMEQVPPMFEQITEENFEQFADMHTAMQNQDFETAREIRDELGLERPQVKLGLNGQSGMHKLGGMKGRMQFNQG